MIDVRVQHLIALMHGCIEQGSSVAIKRGILLFTEGHCTGLFVRRGAAFARGLVRGFCACLDLELQS